MRTSQVQKKTGRTPGAPGAPILFTSRIPYLQKKQTAAATAALGGSKKRAATRTPTKTVTLASLEDEKKKLYKELMNTQYHLKKIPQKMDLLKFYGDAPDPIINTGPDSDQYCINCFVQKNQAMQSQHIELKNTCFDSWEDYEKKYNSILNKIQDIDNQIYNIKYVQEHGINQKPEIAANMDYYMNRLFRQFI
jgi:hypothetical protein